MKKTALIVLAAGLLTAQTGIDVEQLQARGTGKVLVRVGTGFFNVRAAALEGLTVTPGTPPVLSVTAVPPSETLSMGQRAEVAAMIAAAAQTVTPGYVSYYPSAPTEDFVITQATVPGSLRVYANGALQSEGPEGTAHYEVNGSTVHFWPATVPHAGWWVHLAWIDQPF